MKDIENKLGDIVLRVQKLEADLQILEWRFFTLQMTVISIVFAIAVVALLTVRRSQRRMRETSHLRTRVDMSDLPHK